MTWHSMASLLPKYETLYPYDPGTLPGSANQCILAKVYLRSNPSRKYETLWNDPCDPLRCIWSPNVGQRPKLKFGLALA